MAKKYTLRTICYLAIYALLALTEKKTGLHGLCLAFCVALVFCRENLLLAVVPYVASCALVHFDLVYSAVAAGGAASVLLYALIRYKSGKKYRIWANVLVIAVSQVPIFFLFADTTEQLVKAAVSLPVSALFHYVAIAAAYPVLVRGARYEKSEREKIFAAVFVIPLAAGLAVFEVYGVGFLYFAVVVGCLLLAPFDTASALGFAVGAGAGASLITGDAFGLCAAAAIGGAVCALRNANKYVCGIAAIGTYIACLYLFSSGITLKNVLPVAAACLAVFIPDKVFYRAKGCRQSYHGKFALRTLANRDREEVGAKLRSVAAAFRRMETLLESDDAPAPTATDFAEALSATCCAECGKLAVCREKAGGGGRCFAGLAATGMEKGKVNLLDVDPDLGAICVRLPRVINTANAFLREYTVARERRSGAEQGRDMVTGNLLGTAELLEELAASVSKGFGFDVEGEKRVTDELACANIIAGDTAIYGNGDKITLTVRECDEKKPELKKIVSSAAGTGMYVAERSQGVNGTVNLVFRPTPAFGVLYGEKSVSAENECGDARQAVRVAPDKLMFVLSDGMGTGEEAHKTGVGTIGLIETFYRAGFGHKTIFNCVSRLLALRTKETFSALDVAVMDTQTGEIDFIKQGGRESYVVTERGVEVIEGGSLPMGIIGESEPIIVRRKLRHNDLAVLISDGVADRLNETDITEIIGSLNTLNPQIIAEKIVENALRKQDGRKDDMTAMTLRVVDNAAANGRERRAG